MRRVAGGYSGTYYPNNYLRSAEIYDPVSGIWSVTGSLNVARSGHTATLLLDGRVLVIGGYGDPPSAELYDPMTGSWTSMGYLFLESRGYSVTLLRSGKVLIAGGYDDATVYVYDPASGKLTATGGLKAARSGHTATLLKNGRVLVTGGEFDFFEPGTDINLDFCVLRTTELYDPVAGTWSPGPDLNTGFDDHIAVSVADKKVMVLGGLDDSFVPEIYDPDLATWSNTNSPSQGRIAFTATSLANGTVIIAGGTSHELGSYLSSAEVYDDRSGTWTTTSDMITGRSGHSATLLADGKVLVAGGVGSGETILGSAELYEPAVAPPPGTIGPDFTGAWYDPAQSGHGLIIEVLPDSLCSANIRIGTN